VYPTIVFGQTSIVTFLSCLLTLPCVDGVCVNVAKSLHTQFEATKKKTHIKRSRASKEGALINLARSWDHNWNQQKEKHRKRSRASEGPK
jgi:hypothetical protein